MLERTMTNLWFVDYFDAVAEKKQKLKAPFESLDKKRHKM